LCASITERAPGCAAFGIGARASTSDVSPNSAQIISAMQSATGIRLEKTL
jgi:cobalamin biosynthesis protein CobD/CbiB